METWLLIGCRLCDVTMFLQKMLFYAVILRNFGKLVSYYWFSSASTPFQLSIIKSRRWDVSFNPRLFSVFRHLRQWRGGGWYNPPWRSAPHGRRASRKIPVDASRWDLAIAHIVFSPRSTFDLVRSGQRSNFRENWHFSDLHANSGVSMCRIDLKPSPACSPFNSEQDSVLLLYPVTTCSIRSAPK